MQVQAVVFTALGLETASVLRHLQNQTQECFDSTWLHFGTTRDGLTVGVCEVGPGNSSAAAAASAVLTTIKPLVAAFVGVAGGVKDVKLGDVVVATKVYGYESGKEGRAGFLPRPDLLRTHHALEQVARAVRQRTDWHSLLDPAQWTEGTPAVLVEPIAAGEKVVATNKKATALFLKASYSDAVAVEMEGRGFLEAVHVVGDVAGAVVRGISDLLEKKARSDAANWQPRASDAAAAFLFAMLSRHLLRTNKQVRREEKGDAEAVVGLDYRILNGDSELMNKITAAVKEKAPRHFAHLCACVAFAKDAMVLADRAVERAAAARAAAPIPTASSLKIERGAAPQMFKLARGLGACIWDSADEFVGEFKRGRPSGVGVYKIYQIHHKMVPDQVNFFKGEVRSEKELGPLGVYEFLTGTVFAGEWHGSRPRRGYMSFSRSEAPFTFYFGDIREMSDHAWVPDGRGIGISMELGEITHGEFVNGRAGPDCIDISLP